MNKNKKLHKAARPLLLMTMFKLCISYRITSGCESLKWDNRNMRKTIIIILSSAVPITIANT